MPVLFPTSLVGSYAQPEWLIDRAKLAGRFPPRTRAKELWRVAPEFLEQAEAVSVNPLDEMVRGELREELHRGLERLKPVDRATLEAFYLRGRSLKQMSREFDTPIGTIKRRLHVARNRLREQLEGAASFTETAEQPRIRRSPRRPRELTCV